jgi:glutathionylspermidine synthase
MSVQDSHSASDELEDKKDRLSGSSEEDEEDFEEDFDPTSIPINESVDTKHNKDLAQRCGLTRKTREHRQKFDVSTWNDGLIYNYADEDNNPLWGEGIYYSLTPQLAENIKKATHELHQLCLKAVAIIVNNEKYLRQLCIPKNFWPLVRASWARKDFHIYGRFDLGIPCDVNQPPKLFEYNADTPIMLLESSKLQRQWAIDAFGEDAKQFNDIKDNLLKRWIEIKPTLLSRLGWFRKDAKIHFTAVDDQEDMATLNILQRTASEAGFDTAHIEVKDIGWNGDGFKDLQNQKIEILFKLYPWEWFIDEVFSDQWAKDKVVVIEPIWKLILSNKALLPVLWELFPNHPNLLPAYFTEEEATQHLSESGYVKKPIFGRQGENVTIHKNDETLLETKGQYGAEGFVYQQFMEVPSYDTSKGKWTTAVGSWVIGDAPSGIIFRESKSLITTVSSVICCHVIQDANDGKEEDKASS